MTHSAMDTSKPTTVGLLHPGEMGAAVGRCLTGAGRTVLWASQGRSAATAARAAAAGMIDVRDVRQVAAQSTVIISVCPPHAALDVAWAAHGFTGLYLDANAIAPGTATEVSRLIVESGGRYVDGGIIGPPPLAPGTTRLYLSGVQAPEIHALFSGTGLEPRIVSGPDTAASAVKMTYAAWTKGSSALLLTARAVARAAGVEDALLQEWSMSQPHLTGQLDRTARAAAANGWRWVAEMEEIAAFMAGAGLPDGFHQAAAEVYRRCPPLRESAHDEQLTANVLAALTGP